MSTDLRPAPPAAADAVVTPAAVVRRRGLLLLAAFAWNTWVWGTRIWNLLTGPEFDTRTTGFVAVHLVLYATSIAVGVVVGAIGLRLWRDARDARDAAATSA